MNHLFLLPNEIIANILCYLDDIIPICLTNNRIKILNNYKWWINKFKINRVTIPDVLSNTLNEWMVNYKTEKVIDYIKNREPNEKSSITLVANHYVYYFQKLSGRPKFIYKSTKVEYPLLINEVLIGRHIHIYGVGWKENLLELKNYNAGFNYTDADILKIRPFIYKCFKLSIINFTVNTFGIKYGSYS